MEVPKEIPPLIIMVRFCLVSFNQYVYAFTPPDHANGMYHRVPAETVH